MMIAVYIGGALVGIYALCWGVSKYQNSAIWPWGATSPQRGPKSLPRKER